MSLVQSDAKKKVGRQRILFRKDDTDKALGRIISTQRKKT